MFNKFIIILMILVQCNNAIKATNDTLKNNKYGIKSLLSFEFLFIKQNPQTYWSDMKKWALHFNNDYRSTYFPIGHELRYKREFWYYNWFVEIGVIYKNIKEISYFDGITNNFLVGAVTNNSKRTMIRQKGLIELGFGHIIYKIKKSKIIVYSGFQKNFISKDNLIIEHINYNSNHSYLPGSNQDFLNFGLFFRKNFGLIQISIPFEVELSYYRANHKSVAVYYKTGFIASIDLN